MKKHFALFIKQPSHVAIIATLIYWTITMLRIKGHNYSDLIPIGIFVLYLFYVINDNNRFIKNVMDISNIPYCIITNKPHNESESIVKEIILDLTNDGIKIEKTLNYFNIKKTEWIYHKESRIPDATWKQEIKEIEKHFFLLKSKIPSKTCFHFNFVTPPEISLGIGAAFGKRELYKSYHYFGAKRIPICEGEKKGGDTYHRMNQRVSDYREINIERTDINADDTAIILNFVGHPISSVQKAFTNNFNEIKLSHKLYPGHLPIEYDWTRLSIEICSVIFKEAETNKRLHLFFGMPSSLSFVVGTVLANYIAITVYNFDKAGQKYNEVFKLNEL